MVIDNALYGINHSFGRPYPFRDQTKSCPLIDYKSEVLLPLEIQMGNERRVALQWEFYTKHVAPSGESFTRNTWPPLVRVYMRHVSPSGESFEWDTWRPPVRVLNETRCTLWWKFYMPSGESFTQKKIQQVVKVTNKFFYF